MDKSINTKIHQTVTDAILHARQQLINDMGINPIVEKITSYPKRIREQQDKMTTLAPQLKAAKSNLVAVEGLLMAEITAEIVEGTGKPKYSNDKARQAELARRMQYDPEYNAALKQFNSAEEAYNSAQFDLQQLQDEFKAYITVGELMAAKIRALS